MSVPTSLFGGALKFISKMSPADEELKIFFCQHKRIFELIEENAKDYKTTKAEFDRAMNLILTLYKMKNEHDNLRLVFPV